MTAGSPITVYEVGPRDGLQNESTVLSTPQKVELIQALVSAKLPVIEVTSFVSPKWIPPLADADALLSALTNSPARSTATERKSLDPLLPRFTALVPNTKGLARALAAGLHEVAIFMSASETHNQKNINRSVSDTLRDYREVVATAASHGLKARAYLSTVWGCPYEGKVDPQRVVQLTGELIELGCYQVSLGDTIGVGMPQQTRELLKLLLVNMPPEKLAMHMHDTYGTALANVLVGLDAGISTFDAAIGGLGGCPYAPGASGNLATEDLVRLLQGEGYETGIDWEALIAAGRIAQRLLGRTLPSRTLQAELGKRSLA